MNILKELEALRKLLENKNYGEHLALEELVDILIKYWEVEKRNMDRRLTELNSYDSLNTRPRRKGVR